jgi:hypothetical protein
MNRNPVKWIVSAIAVLGLAPVSVLFGLTLLPARATAEKAGTFVPWLLTWAVIGMTALIAVVLAGFLIKTGMSEEATR